MVAKKTLTLKRPTAASKPKPTVDVDEDAPTVIMQTSMPPPTGGATIADRFKLDAPPPAPASAGVGTKIAVAAALVAFVVAGILTYLLYDHWEFLKGA